MQTLNRVGCIVPLGVDYPAWCLRDVLPRYTGSLAHCIRNRVAQYRRIRTCGRADDRHLVCLLLRVSAVAAIARSSRGDVFSEQRCSRLYSRAAEALTESREIPPSRLNHRPFSGTASVPLHLLYPSALVRLHYRDWDGSSDESPWTW